MSELRVDLSYQRACSMYVRVIELQKIAGLGRNSIHGKADSLLAFFGPITSAHVFYFIYFFYNKPLLSDL